jgi:hypothetical protein
MFYIVTNMIIDRQRFGKRSRGDRYAGKYESVAMGLTHVSWQRIKQR